MSAKLLTMDSAQSVPELRRRALGVADALRDRGISAGDRVILKSGNSAGFVAVLLGLMHLGASVVLLDQRQRPAESARIARLARVRLAVVDGETPPVPGPESVSGYELLASAAGRSPADQTLRFDTWSELPDALITWTSGSTGEPKGIVKPGRAMLRNLERTIERMGYRPDDVLLPLLPFSHQYGLSLVLISYLAGCSLIVAPYGRLDRAVWMAGRARATIVDATPAVFLSLVNLVEKRAAIRADLGAVRMFCTGGAPLDQSAADRFTATFGAPLLDGYGSSELGNIAFATTANPVGCGRVLDGVEVRITDEDGAALPPGEVGELVVRTPDSFAGYLNASRADNGHGNNGGADAGEFTPAGRDWYPAGDLGMFDAAGNLFVLGRKSAVHRLGYTLYPEIIGHKAAACGAPVRVVALPDERLGSRLVFLVEDPANRGQEFWRERFDELLPDYEQPNKIVVIERFPLIPNGKPDRKMIGQIAQSAIAGEDTIGEHDAIARHEELESVVTV